MLRTCCVFTFWIICSIAEAANISGVPRVVDGDTLVVGATKSRLEGIDAPETDQICLNAKGERWTCGIEARDRLQAHIAGRVIGCSSNGADVYHRSLATCSLSGENLNAWMAEASRPFASAGLAQFLLNRFQPVPESAIYGAGFSWRDSSRGDVGQYSALKHCDLV